MLLIIWFAGPMSAHATSLKAVTTAEQHLPQVIAASLQEEKSWPYSMRNNVIRHAREGAVFLQRKRYDEAAEAYKLALRLNPASSLSASLFNNLGQAYLGKGETLLAIASYQQAIRLQPSFELYYKNLIHAYEKSGNLPLATEQLRRILHHNPQDAEAWYLIGLAFEQQQQPTSARQAFENFVMLQPNLRLKEAAQQHLAPLNPTIR